MLIEELEIFKKEFERIKKMGYIKSCKSGPTSIIKTFEKCLYANNTLKFPHIKMQINKKETREYTTLFKAPCTGRSELDLRRMYGEQDAIYKKTKVFNVSVQANCFTLMGRFLFRLYVNYEEQKVYMLITDQNMMTLDRRVYWTFEDLKDKLYKRLNYLVLIKCWINKVGISDFYKFYDYDFYKLKDFSCFLKLLSEGTIRITFKVGVNKSGNKRGQVIDRGTCFEIQELDMDKLLQKVDMNN